MYKQNIFVVTEIEQKSTRLQKRAKVKWTAKGYLCPGETDALFNTIQYPESESPSKEDSDSTALVVGQVMILNGLSLTCQT